MKKDKGNLKKVLTKDLKVGMYVQDVGRSWLTHPWAVKSKLLTSQREIQQLLQHGITEVIIDLSKGVTSKSIAQAAKEPEPPMKIQEVERRKEHRPAEQPDPVTMEEEFPMARQAYFQALGVTREFINDIRAGRKVDVEKVHESVDQMIESIFRNRDSMVALLKLKTYDEYTFTHCINVATLSVSLGRNMDFSREYLMELGLGGIYHDVGKTGIPTEILNKPGRLTAEEFEIVKRHPLIGFNIMEKYSKVPSPSLSVVRHHHERLDGQGYPDGKSGDQILPFIIISGLSDVYDALTSNRIYRHSLPPHEALKIIFSLRGQQFPETWVDRFIQTLGIYPVGTTVKLNTKEIGVVMSVNRSNTLRPQVRIAFNPGGLEVTRKRMVDLNEQKFYDREIVQVIDPRELGFDPALFFEGSG